MSLLCLLARVHEERYAFHVEAVREVARSLDVTPVPGAPPPVRGVHNLHGEVIAVVDLAVLLGLPAGEGQGVVVAEHGRRRAGLTVDDLLDVTELPEKLEPAEPPLAGSAVLDGELVGVLDVGRLLDAVERVTPA